MIKYIIAVIIVTSLVLCDTSPKVENKDSISKCTYVEVEISVDVPINRSAPEPLTIDLGEFEITAYDLSVQSCGKRTTHPEYGLTANGTDLVGQTWKTVRAVAVDPKIIPLGTKLQITFDNPEYLCYNGVYQAVDTGSAIIGKKLDLFLGENAIEECVEFGITTANVFVLE